MAVSANQSALAWLEQPPDFDGKTVNSGQALEMERRFRLDADGIAAMQIDADGVEKSLSRRLRWPGS